MKNNNPITEEETMIGVAIAAGAAFFSTYLAGSVATAAASAVEKKIRPGEFFPMTVYVDYIDCQLLSRGLEPGEHLVLVTAEEQALLYRGLACLNSDVPPADPGRFCSTVKEGAERYRQMSSQK